jgi:heterodisulfide reductase subunit B
MGVLYLPGCTLKNKAANFDRSTVDSMARLGVELTELDRWNCCGTVFSMTGDDLMQQLAPVRNLLRAEEQGDGPLLVPCSMCFNTLVRAKQFAADPARRDLLNDFMYREESSYEGRMQVVHPLTYLRDELGFERVRDKVTQSLSGMKLAAYYGCMLTRPAEMAIDDPERPRVFEDLLEALGAEPVKFELRLECCGSYQTLSNLAVTLERNQRVLASAARAGAEALVTSCPLCAYNLDQMQREAIKQYPDLDQMPIFYYSELMAVALGAGWDTDWTPLHGVDPSAFLETHGLA